MSLRYTAVGRTASQLNAQVPAELAAFSKGMQLMPDKFAQRVLTGHALHLLGMGELLLGEGAKSGPQDFAVEPILAPEVVVDGGLVDARLGDDGADTGFSIAMLGEEPLGGFDDAFAGDVGRSRHIPWVPFSNYRLKTIGRPIIGGLQRSSGGNVTPPPSRSVIC
jgi:hypothetical protein